MTDQGKIICSITAFSFLGLFISIPYLPANWVLELYVFMTQEVVAVVIISLIPVMIYFGIKDKEWGYALFLIIVMTGQVMFVHVYADNYHIAKTETPKPLKIHYHAHWNKA